METDPSEQETQFEDTEGEGADEASYEDQDAAEEGGEESAGLDEAPTGP
jgi:hypothetical protein